MLRLGASESSIYAVFTNDRLEFRALGNDDPVAYIAVDEKDNIGKLYASNAVVNDFMQFGHWRFYERENANMSIRWIDDGTDDDPVDDEIIDDGTEGDGTEEGGE